MRPARLTVLPLLLPLRQHVQQPLAQQHLLLLLLPHC
jgi:hypothetical protein